MRHISLYIMKFSKCYVVGKRCLQVFQVTNASALILFLIYIIAFLTVHKNLQYKSKGRDASVTVETTEIY